MNIVSWISRQIIHGQFIKASALQKYKLGINNEYIQGNNDLLRYVKLKGPIQVNYSL